MADKAKSECTYTKTINYELLPWEFFHSACRQMVLINLLDFHLTQKRTWLVPDGLYEGRGINFVSP